MNILLISDTHGATIDIEKLLEQYKRSVELVCHMGDNAVDIQQFEQKYPQYSFVVVSGNTDVSPMAHNEVIISLTAKNKEVKKVLLTHGHKQYVKSGLDRLKYYAKSQGVDACFFGHTHYPYIEEAGGIFYMNPGSLIAPHVGFAPSFGLVSLQDNGVFAGMHLAINAMGLANYG